MFTIMIKLTQSWNRFAWAFTIKETNFHVLVQKGVLKKAFVWLCNLVPRALDLLDTRNSWRTLNFDARTLGNQPTRCVNL